jgi:hypothetical protein
MEPIEAQHWSLSAFGESMVLLDDIVKILVLA